MIPVTKPFLPSKQIFDSYINGIWHRQWLTNHGPLVNELELKLKDYLRVKHLLYLSNGTIAIQIAIKALKLSGDIITTPFSYVATTTSIIWENCNPVFADIDEDSLNIDPQKIEAAITPETTAIIATHVFGNPCDIDSIEAIAEKYKLKVIYDAAHCFGTTFKNKSVFEYGDISATSFHATKLFHTIEGGAVLTKNPELLKDMSYLRNFGHETAESFAMLGINGKNSEFHAAMGLSLLPEIDKILKRRKELCIFYDKRLESLEVKHQKMTNGATYNYGYYPIIFKNEEMLVKSMYELNKYKIFPRRYFYPSLDTLPYIVNSQICPISRDIASRIICLPLYHDLSFEEIDMIARILLRVQNN